MIKTIVFLRRYRKSKKNIIFEQDGARAHTIKSNLNLLNKIFWDNKWI